MRKTFKSFSNSGLSDIVENPIRINCCDHLHCKLCFDQIEERKCPVCRQDFTNSRIDITSKNFIESLEFRCAENACQVKFENLISIISDFDNFSNSKT